MLTGRDAFAGGFVGAGVLFGLGLGGFFDGIVLHPLLQSHHMLSSWYPPTTLENLRLDNTRWDGVFHSATCVFVLAGLWRLCRLAEVGRAQGPTARLVGSLLAGWGLFNVVEGLVDHFGLGIHHVNEVAPRAQQFARDLRRLQADSCGLGEWRKDQRSAGSGSRGDRAVRLRFQTAPQFRQV